MKKIFRFLTIPLALIASVLKDIKRYIRIRNM